MSSLSKSWKRKPKDIPLKKIKRGRVRGGAYKEGKGKKRDTKEIWSAWPAQICSALKGTLAEPLQNCPCSSWLCKTDTTADAGWPCHLGKHISQGVLDVWQNPGKPHLEQALALYRKVTESFGITGLTSCWWISDPWRWDHWQRAELTEKKPHSSLSPVITCAPLFSLLPSLSTGETKGGFPHPACPARTWLSSEHREAACQGIFDAQQGLCAASA